jgi:hypothetical protein
MAASRFRMLRPYTWRSTLWLGLLRIVQTSLAFNFANPKITDEFARIAPGRNKSAAAFVLVMRLWPLPPVKAGQ